MKRFIDTIPEQINDYGAIKEIKTYRPKRKCKICEHRLSIYNPSDICNCCRIKLVNKNYMQYYSSTNNSKKYELNETIRNIRKNLGYKR